MKFLVLYWLSLVALATCLLTCSSGDHGEPFSLTNQDYKRGEMDLQHGMQLFNRHCASCHDFSENGIGPNLAGLTAEVSKDWIMAFIKNSPQMIQDGDVRAVQLFEKYKQYMPPFAMFTDDEMEHLLAFIHKFSNAERRKTNDRPGGLLNPIPEIIDTSPLILVLEEYLTVPPSSEVAPSTRINKMNPNAGGRVFLHDIRGKMYEVHQDTLTEYFDLASQFENFVDNPGKGTGFASWAFHPDFSNNGLWYTTHSEAPNSQKADFALPDSIRTTLQFVLTEWQTEEPLAKRFSGSGRELLRVDMFGGAHTFQEVTFNPLVDKSAADYGMLYLGIGDASMGIRYPEMCDSFSHIYGSVIRLDPAGNNAGNGNYGIPQDNPFVGRAGAVEEVWARGFRNPHRICWDMSGSGHMFITNIGQHSVEEVNLGTAGADYGWPYREGTFLFDSYANPELVYPLPQDDNGYTYPIIQYDHDEGSAVSGGFVYNGKRIPALRGKYIFGDISLGTLFYSEVNEMVAGVQAPVYRLQVAMDGQLSTMAKIAGHRRVDLRIGFDDEGELYLLTKGNGGVYKIVDCQLSGA